MLDKPPKEVSSRSCAASVLRHGCKWPQTCTRLSHGLAKQDSKLNHVWIWLTGFKLSVRLTTGVSSAFPMPPPHHDAKKLLRVLVRLLCWKKRLLIVLNGFNTGHLWAGACALRAIVLSTVFLGILSTMAISFKALRRNFEEHKYLEYKELTIT